MVVPSVTCLLIAAALMAAWYFWYRRVNQGKAAQILEWVEGALAGQGHVLGIRWITASRFRIPLRLPSGFRRASIYVELLPRELPFSWAYDRMKHRHDQLTFEADLDLAPKFNLQVFHHRWCGRTRKKLQPSGDRWCFDQGAPMVITSRSDWQRDIMTMMNALLASREHEFLGIGFRRSSPHFSACMRLETLAPREGCSVFEVLRELATDASAAKF